MYYYLVISYFFSFCVSTDVRQGVKNIPFEFEFGRGNGKNWFIIKTYIAPVTFYRII